MTQNTLKQTPLKHIFGKERGNGKMWVPSMLVAVQPQLWAEGPSLSLAAPSAQPNDGCRQASLWKEFHIFHKLYGNQEIQLGTSRLRGGLGPRVEKKWKGTGAQCLQRRTEPGWAEVPRQQTDQTTTSAPTPVY